MTDQVSVDHVVRQLQGILREGGLPDKKRGRAETLLGRLQTPVRVVFMGRPGDGQPTLINHIIGRDLTPLSAERPSQEICFGHAPKATIHLPDGRIQEVAGEPLPGQIARAMFVQRVCDAPALESISILDLAMDGTPSGIDGAIRWAAPKADIAVWCSPTFSEHEMAIWNRVPDAVKDHAFLALLDDRDGARANRLRSALGGEFVDVFATREVVQPDGESDRTLIGAIHKQVAQGRQADAANALLFLKMNGAKAAPTAANAPIPLRKPSSATRPAQGHRDASAEPQSPALQAAMRTGCAFIVERAEGLLADLSGQDDLRAAGVVSACAETIRQVSDIFDTVPEAEGPAVGAVMETLMEAEELSVLLEIERDGTPEIDAACLLLQLRDELQAQIAA